MKVLVSCDDWCYRVDDDFYLRDFGVTLVNRYLMSFDSIRFAVRTKDVDNIEDLGKYKYKVTDKRIEIFPLPFFQGPKQYAKVYFKTERMLKDVADGCDMAILRLPSTVAFAVWKKINAMIPYAVELVADCFDFYKNSHSLLQKMIWYSLHKNQKKATANAIGVSCVTQDYLQTHYTSNLPNAIFSHYSSIEMLSNFRYKAREYPQKEVLDVILVANQVYLNSGKGHKMIIDTFKILKDRGCQARLTLVGEDYFGGIKQVQDYAETLGVSGMIRFTGFVDTTRLKKLLIESDILVLPTVAEGLPRVIIEGIALGLPCITTPVSGNPELIDKEFLIEYSNARGFADKIELLINNKSLYEYQSSVNYERSVKYSKEILDARRKDFFDALKINVKKIQRSI